MPGITELILLLIILFIVFGARSLPALGEAIGRRRARRHEPQPTSDEARPPAVGPGKAAHPTAEQK